MMNNMKTKSTRKQSKLPYMSYATYHELRAYIHRQKETAKDRLNTAISLLGVQELKETDEAPVMVGYNRESDNILETLRNNFLNWNNLYNRQLEQLEYAYFKGRSPKVKVKTQFDKKSR